MKIKIRNFIIEIKLSLIIMIIINIIFPKIKEMFHYYFACYLFIMFHEFSHILVALILNFKCNKIELSMCGMCANIMLINKFKREIIIYMAGPLSNFLLAYIFRKNNFVFGINLFLGIINLMPVYPLDGYRIFSLLKLNIKVLQLISYCLIVVFIILTKNLSLCIFFVYVVFLRLNTKYKEKNSW